MLTAVDKGYSIWPVATTLRNNIANVSDAVAASTQPGHAQLQHMQVMHSLKTLHA
jgi:hypothetical protein